jgi:HK97 family phage prohead protease
MTKKNNKSLVNKTGREIRIFSDFKLKELRSDDGDERQDYVHGVPVVFNTPTCLYEFEGVKFYEQIDRHAFDSCDMSDVIFNYNHGGPVLARLRNNTLKLAINDVCMEMDAFLGGTNNGRNTLEEIRGGYIDKMSFAFVVADDEYDPATHTRTITRIKKLYDVSAVDIPAYDTTSISARSFFEVEYEKEKRALEQARLREICIAKSKI